MWVEREMSTRGVDGVELPGTICAPSEDSPRHFALLVHGGGGVDRHEDGFFDRLSEFLRTKGIASIRFDHRAFLANSDERIAVTINGMCNDILSMCRWVADHYASATIHLVAASFGGGAALLAGTATRDRVGSIILLNPLIDYKARLLEEKPFWRNGRLTTEGARELRSVGHLRHGSTLRMSAALINEASLFDPTILAPRVIMPTLLIHGTKDHRIPHALSVDFGARLPNAKVMLIDGADHGFTVPGDEDYSEPQTIQWQEAAFGWTADWIYRADQVKSDAR